VVSGFLLFSLIPMGVMRFSTQPDVPRRLGMVDTPTVAIFPIFHGENEDEPWHFEVFLDRFRLGKGKI